MKKLGILGLCIGMVALIGCDDSSGATSDNDGGTDGSITFLDGKTDEDGDVSEVCRGAIPCANGATCSVPGYECQPQLVGAYGGAEDPIIDHPVSEDSEVEINIFTGGYCTPSNSKLITDSASCAQNENACGDCAICARTQYLSNQVMCFQKCAPSITDNDCPGENQCISIDGTAGYCFPAGCGTDDECHIRRVDTNNNGRIDPYDATENPEGDHLQYISSTTEGFSGFTASCDPVRKVCVHSGTAGAEAGDACLFDFECEANGRCISGACTKFDCDLAGNACAGAGVCVEGACFKPCKVKDQVDAEDPTSQHKTCGEDQACLPMDGVTAPNDGICVAGNYNDVGEPNIGNVCLDSDTCYSPYGLGTCEVLTTSGNALEAFCSISNCADSPLSGICGEGATCVSTSETDSYCLRDCTTGADCDRGQSCIGLQSGKKVCVAGGCSANTDCGSGICDTNSGVCTQACTDATSCSGNEACATVGSFGKICVHFCEMDAECEGSETCVKAEGNSYGLCTSNG
ncbi:MAG: hypothetical protein R3A78_07245 [Polyangiales bacterium]|nr:hypothetical protein [Myxococcales bacterium]